MNKSLFYINQTIALIAYYSFDLGTYTTQELIRKWSKKYPHFWLPLAVLEAIYQGRLKAVSVGQILILWEKFGKPNYKFNDDFKSLVVNNIYDEINDQFYLDDNVHNLIDVSNLEENDDPNLTSISEITKTNNLPSSKSKSSSAIVVYNSSIPNFQPLADYSKCYKQLKSFAKLGIRY